MTGQAVGGKHWDGGCSPASWGRDFAGVSMQLGMALMVNGMEPEQSLLGAIKEAPRLVTTAVNHPGG